MWLFTTQKFEGHRPFTVKANYEGFAEGMKLVLRVELVLCMKNELVNQFFVWQALWWVMNL